MTVLSILTLKDSNKFLLILLLIYFDNYRFQIFIFVASVYVMWFIEIPLPNIEELFML